jgi:hypothetical protein
MKEPEVLNRVDKKKLRTWLRTLVIPWIVKPIYFAQMGFPEVFVRQYWRKHNRATKLNGETIRGVRGICETDFLWGLAEALGADTSGASRTQSSGSRTRLCVEACLAALDRIERGEQAKEPRIAEPAD